MRLFVIPISTRRALIYSRAISKGQTPKELSWTDRVTGKAAEKWAQWEEAEKGWKKHLVTWGNRVQQRIPFEEWGLKSIPSLSAQRRMDETHGKKKIDVLFPGNAIKPGKLQAILMKIATERQELHRKKMWWSFIAAPITAPIALIPMYVRPLRLASCIEEVTCKEAPLTMCFSNATTEYLISHFSISSTEAGRIGGVSLPPVFPPPSK